jgi:hypothetical protein
LPPCPSDSAEQRIVEQAPKSPQRVADGRRAEVQARGGSPGISFLEQQIKQQEQV